jgi:hypothetical protein
MRGRSNSRTLRYTLPSASSTCYTLGSIVFQRTPAPTPPSASSPRLRLTRRAAWEHLPPFRLTSRDISIIRAVDTCRALTTPQVQALLFARTLSESASHGEISSRCQRRLQLLYHYGYLLRDEQPQRLSEGRKPLVYFLDERGAQLLAEQSGIEPEQIDWRRKDSRVSYPFLAHLLATNDVRIAVMQAAGRLGWCIERWLDDKALKSRHMKDYVTLVGPQGGEKRAAVVPDGYFALDTGQAVHHHLLEIDLRTVIGRSSQWGRRDWARKVAAYLAYYRSGNYQRRYSAGSMRVLTITTGERRLANLKGITERAGGRARFWFTTFERVTPQTVLTQPIWQVGGRQNLHSLLR